MSRRRALGRFGGDRRGATAVMVALFSAALVGFAALGIDGASFFVAKRRLQNATDVAAMAAAETPDQAAAAAANLMTANGVTSPTLQVTRGTYTADASLSPAARFVASPSGTAVKVVSTIQQPLIFGGALATLAGGHATTGFPIRTTAIAQKQDLATMTLGTGLAALDGGLLNAVLGSLTGTRLSLSLLDYQSLASASIDLFDLGGALAARLRLSAGTYGGLAATTTTESTLLASIADVMQGDGRAGPAVQSIVAAGPPASVTLAGLVNYGPAATASIGAHPLSARVGVLDLIMAMARLGGDRNVAAVDLGTTVPGLGATQFAMTTGESNAGSAFVAVGPEGTTLHSAQVRLLLSTQIGGTGLPATITLPIYIEVASGTATIASIACAGGAAMAGVTLSVSTGLVDAWIGQLAPGTFGDLTRAPTVTAATLFDVLGVMHVTAFGHLSPSASTPVSVPFAAADIRAATTKTVSSGLSLADTMTSLLGQTQISVSMLGLNLPQPALPSTITSAITAVLPAIDQLLARTLATLGVSVGTATTSVPGVRCGQGQLVN